MRWKHMQEPESSLVILSKVLAKRGCFTFVGNGNLEGSAVLGVWIAVRGGGHEWVISCKEIERSSLQDFLLIHTGEVLYFKDLHGSTKKVLADPNVNLRDSTAVRSPPLSAAARLWWRLAPFLQAYLYCPSNKNLSEACRDSSTYCVCRIKPQPYSYHN